ncbi:hypothetical protein K435DRAFT_804345 [Dendrothele bispora CBS 962.96]|uniref:Uncharacterized protein n=1 Tax=Dendrothele bispora (strain CBS 962.96) TaxID=1314807 RepID=A0A4S8LFD4_DENBC|nr:hypothetical protein K435DRAFT_804345 [Dendrothele bispora CBS 962.96]
MRGPSSSAFMELLAIDGLADHLGLSYRNANELNKIINSHSPGRPCFQYQEAVVQGLSAGASVRVWVDSGLEISTRTHTHRTLTRHPCHTKCEWFLQPTQIVSGSATIAQALDNKHMVNLFKRQVETSQSTKIGHNTVA